MSRAVSQPGTSTRRSKNLPAAYSGSCTCASVPQPIDGPLLEQTEGVAVAVVDVPQPGLLLGRGQGDDDGAVGQAAVPGDLGDRRRVGRLLGRDRHRGSRQRAGRGRRCTALVLGAPDDRDDDCHRDQDDTTTSSPRCASPTGSSPLAAAAASPGGAARRAPATAAPTSASRRGPPRRAAWCAERSSPPTVGRRTWRFPGARDHVGEAPALSRLTTSSLACAPLPDQRSRHARRPAARYRRDAADHAAADPVRAASGGDRARRARGRPWCSCTGT